MIDENYPTLDLPSDLLDQFKQRYEEWKMVREQYSHLEAGEPDNVATGALKKTNSIPQ
jgi:hypothetical protein